MLIRSDFEDILRRLLASDGVDFDGLVNENVLFSLLPPDCEPTEMESLVDFLANRGYYMSFVPETLEPLDDSVDYTNAFFSYMSVLRGLTPLGEVEEEELLKRLITGDKTARRLLLEGYLWLVLNIAREKGRKREDILEYIQEGNLGLLKAVESFKPGGKKSFRDFARWQILKSIAKFQRDNQLLSRIPHQVLKFFQAFRETGKKLSNGMGHPSIEDISNAMQLPASTVRENLLLGASLTSHESLLEDSHVSISRYIREVRATADLEVEKSTSLKEALREKISILEPLEKEIITLYYGLADDEREHEFVDIAEELGLKVGLVMDIESTALTKITLQVKEERNLQ